LAVALNFTWPEAPGASVPVRGNLMVSPLVVAEQAVMLIGKAVVPVPRHEVVGLTQHAGITGLYSSVIISF